MVRGFQGLLKGGLQLVRVGRNSGRLKILLNHCIGTTMNENARLKQIFLWKGVCLETMIRMTHPLLNQGYGALLTQLIKENYLIDSL